MPAPGAKEVSGKVSDLLATLATRGVPVYLVCSLYGEPVKPGSLRPPVAVPTGSSTPLAPVPSGGVPDVNVLGMDNIAWETWYSRNVMREAGARVATYHPRTRWLAGRDTGDFLARLSELAQPDSVTAVVLTDVAPNGYASPLPEARSGLTVASGGFIGTDFGYTEAARAAFIEKYVCDPLDLIPVPLAGSAMTPHIPFFPDDVSLSLQWAEFRATKRAAEVAPLVAAIQKMGRGKRVFVPDVRYNDSDGLVPSPVFREVGAKSPVITSASSASAEPTFLMLDEGLYRMLVSPESVPPRIYPSVSSTIIRYQVAKQNCLFTVIWKEPVTVGKVKADPGGLASPRR